LGIAVSGGSDSMALLAILAGQTGRSLHVATVNHRLRPGAAADVALVAARARSFGLPHTELTWDDWSGRGNLQAEARNARKRLITDWAQKNEISFVATGHTQDDQAETLLLRLARGSGVDGLAAIPPYATQDGITWLRPLIGTSRGELQSWLRSNGETWADDPSNSDPRFDRTKARAAVAALAPLGLSRAGLAETAGRMREASQVLDNAAYAVAARHLSQQGADLLIPVEALSGAMLDTRNRLLAHLLQTVSGQVYRPRFSALGAAIKAVASGQTHTLHGCLLTQRNGVLRVSREPAAVAMLSSQGPIWDRWQIAGRLSSGHSISALGAEAYGALPNNLDAMPRSSLAASPAIRERGRLICAPLAAFGRGFQCWPVFSRETTLSSLLAH